MRSSARLFAVALLATLALPLAWPGARAFAQVAPDGDTPPPPPPPEPEPSPEPDASPAPDEPEELPPDELPPQPVFNPTPSASPDASPEPSASPSPDSDSDGGGPGRPKPRGLIIGLELGVGGVTGAPAHVYDFGFGKNLVIGYFIGNTTLEWHFAQTYSLRAKETALEGTSTAGNMELSSAGIRQRLFGPRPLLEVYLGAARASVPLLVPGNIDSPGVHTSSAVGVGGLAGVAIGFPIYRLVMASLEVRAGYLFWENPSQPYVVPTGPDPAGSGGVTFDSSSDDIGGTPWTVTLGLRTPLGN